MEVPLCIVFVVLVLLSGFFSASETAYTSVSHVRIERLAAKSRTAKIALFLEDHYDNLLSTILIGNNIVNIAASTIFTLLAVNWFGSDNGPLLSTIITTVLVLTFGEVTPKTLAKARPEFFALLSAYPLVVLYWIFYPLAAFYRVFTRFLLWAFRLDKKKVSLTEDELKMTVEDLKEEGVIPQQEHDLIQQSIVFDDKTVGQIMTPWDRAVKVYSDQTDNEIKEMFEIQNYSRVPYVDSDTGKVLGILLQKDFYEMLIEDNNRVEGILKDPSFYLESMPISQAIRTFQKNKTQFAVVVDMNRRPVGIVTIEDVLEELVGEIDDEHDAEDLEEQELIEESKLAQKEKEKTALKKPKKAEPVRR